MNQYPHETYVEQEVTYTLEVGGKLIVVEHVPARVCVETGEQLFAPHVVERLQSIASGKDKPTRTLQTPVFDFAA
jgi:YgiT-type zinc finger domain-containing protein